MFAVVCITLIFAVSAFIITFLKTGNCPSDNYAFTITFPTLKAITGKRNCVALFIFLLNIVISEVNYSSTI